MVSHKLPPCFLRRFLRMQLACNRLALRHGHGLLSLPQLLELLQHAVNKKLRAAQSLPLKKPEQQLGLQLPPPPAVQHDAALPATEERVGEHVEPRGESHLKRKHPHLKN